MRKSQNNIFRKSRINREKIAELAQAELELQNEALRIQGDQDRERRSDIKEGIIETAIIGASLFGIFF